jgi:hypothetical protein
MAITMDSGQWRVMVPADIEYHTGIKILAGQRATFTSWTGLVKLDSKEIFVNPPQGAYPADKVKLSFPEAWANPRAWTGALLVRLDTSQDYTDVGGRVENSIQATLDGEILLSINCLINERHNASGAYEGIVQIQ